MLEWLAEKSDRSNLPHVSFSHFGISRVSRISSGLESSARRRELNVQKESAVVLISLQNSTRSCSNLRVSLGQKSRLNTIAQLH